MNTVKKLLALLLVVVMLATLFVGCGNKAPATEKEEKTPSSVAKEKESDVSKEPEKSEAKMEDLTIFAGFGEHAAKVIKNYGENLVFQEMEKETGVNVEWLHPPAGQNTEQFNLMVASGDLPDIIVYGWLGVSGGPLKYINDQVIIDLSPYMEEHAPNFMKRMEEYPDARKQVVDDNGNYYVLPMLRLEEQLRIFAGPQIRMDWLESLGVEKPTTMDELYNVLVAMKEGDPNGNGEADEFPLTGIGFRGTNGIGNLVAAWGTSYHYYVKDNAVAFGPAQPEFKEALTFIAKMFEEGLIDPDYMLNDRTKQDGKVTSEISGALYGMQPSNFMNTMAKSGRDPNFLMEGMNWPAGKDGVSYTLERTYDAMVADICGAITTQAQYPDQALEWLDKAYSDEGDILFNLGIEGETFHWDGDKAVYDEVLYGEGEGEGGHGEYSMALNGWPMTQTTLYHEQLMWEYGYPAAEFWRPADRSLLLPQITFTDEESKDVARLQTDIDTYTDEMIDKFVTGKEPIEQFDTFVEKLNSMGLADLTQIYQAAFERYQAR